MVTETLESISGEIILPYRESTTPTSFHPNQRISSWIRKLGPLLGQEPYRSSNFETESSIGEDNRKKIIEYMLNLPGEQGHRLFRASGNLDYISRNATNHRALERMYQGPLLAAENGDRKKLLWARLFIENIHNSMAVRNRLRIVENEFTSYTDQLIKAGATDINVLSIAAGSSRGMVEALARLNGAGYDKIKLRLVDNSPDAIQDAEVLIKEHGVKEVTDLKEVNCTKLNSYLEQGFRPDFVEAVGILDYLPERIILRMFSRIWERLPKGGRLLYSNIMENNEQGFTHKIVGWGEMIYRTDDELMSLALQSGFEVDKLRLIREPLGIYNLVVAEK